MSVTRLSEVQGVDWAVPKPGLRLMMPTSIANSGGSASIGTNGSVSFTGAVTSLSLNGVFTAEFDNYQVVMRSVSTADEYVRARLRLASTDATDTGHTIQRLSADGATITAARDTSQTSLIIGSTSDEQRSGFIAMLYGPALAQPTAARGVTAYGYNSATVFDFASTHSASTSYDGLTLYPSSGALSGALTVYGIGK